MEGDHTLPAEHAAPTGGRIEVGAQAGGRYKILRYIAAGAMGEVYAAEDLIIGSTIALKVLRPELQTSSAALARLRREIALARQVTDVHVCRVHDVGEHAGRVFLTMELLEGKTLAEHVATGPLEIAEVERIARQLIAGLAALHRAGIVHRDFKTANAMIVGERVVIADFGLARSLLSNSDADLTGEAAVIGTPAYMAPEQVEGKPATSASDIYALGAVLFELLTSKRPFSGDSAMAVATARLTQDPPAPSSIRPGIPKRWDAIVARCMARDPAARFARVEDVVGESVAAPRARRRIAIAGAVAAIGIAGAGFAVTRGGSGEAIERPIVKPIAPVVESASKQKLAERRLTSYEGRAPVWNVDLDRTGNRIAYVADNTLWIRELAQPEARRIELPADRTNPRVFGFFPDGHRLLLRTGELGTFSLDLLDLRDRSVKPWRPGIRYARLSPAADRVAYFVAGGIEVAPFEGSGQQLIASIPDLDAYQLAWSTDGSAIAVVVRVPSRPIRIEVFAADGSSRTTLPTGELHPTTGVVWASPDRLIYSRAARPDNLKHAGFATELCTIGVVAGAWDRRPPRCREKRADVALDWLGFAAGRLVFIENRTIHSVETFSLDERGVISGPNTPLRNQEGSTATWGFTRKGDVVMTSAGHGDKGRIVVQAPSSPTGRMLPGGDGSDDFAVGDGDDAIVFTRARPTTCELVRDVGGRQMTIRSEPRGAAIEVCPYLRCALATSRCVLVRMTGTSYVFRRFDLATASEVGPPRQRASSGNVTVDLSHDGSTLVWAIEDSNSPGLALLDVDTGDYREVRSKGGVFPHDVSWLPDTRGWLVAGPDGNWAPTLAWMRPDGTSTPLIAKPSGSVLHNPFRSHDGRTIVVQFEYHRMDIFALEGFE